MEGHMPDYTARQIKQAIEDSDYRWYDLSYCVHSIIPIDGVAVGVTLVDQEGGEGQGEHIWFVIKIGDQLFRKEGYYTSHYGTDWDGPFSEVEPVQKLVTVYEPV
jgi:hypothetical protein